MQIDNNKEDSTKIAGHNITFELILQRENYSNRATAEMQTQTEIDDKVAQVIRDQLIFFFN